jgi:hypothetical protein
MMQHHKAVLILLCSLAAACSSQSRNAKPEVGVAAASSASGTPSSAGAPAATMPSDGAAPAVGAVDQSLVKEGYRVVRRQDKVLYCRTQSTTGTRFTSTVCLTADQIAVLKRDSQDSKDALAKTKPSACLGNMCNN